MKDSATLLRSQCKALRELEPEDFKNAVIALWEYEMDGTIPEDPIAAFAVGMAKPIIDDRENRSRAGEKAAIKRWEKQKGDAIRCEPDAILCEGDAIACDSMRSVCDPMLKEERRKKKDNNISPNGDKVAEYPYKAIVDYLNLKAGTSFLDKSKDTRSHIRARFAEGFSEHDFYNVIDKKVAEWKGTDMAKYLRPATLFGTKFEAYLNQQTGRKSSKQFDNFTPSGTDWNSLADQIMYDTP